MSECTHYILDSAGTRVGCHFDELGEGHTTDDYFFLVNGTSSDTDIQFLDSPSMNGPSLGKTVNRSPCIRLLLCQPLLHGICICPRALEAVCCVPDWPQQDPH